MITDGVPWEDLTVLLAALDHGSLNRAAAALRIGQSTASRRLVRLEERLDARLFDRTPEGLLPTALALSLAPHARLIAGHMGDIARLAHEQEAAPQGRVRLAVVDGLVAHWLAPRLPEFYAQHPAVDVDLITGHAVVDLVRREADLALRFVRPTAADLVVKTLGTVHFRAYAHPSIAPEPQRWVALLDPKAVFQETHWLNEQIAPTHLTRVSTWSALLAAIRAGVGAGLLSPLAAEPAGLVPVALDCAPVPSRTLYLVYHRALRDVPRVAVLRRWLVESAHQLFGER